MRALPLLAASTALAVALWPGAARAYCRATTCEPSADYQPSGGGCEPQGWAAQCAASGYKDLAVWWRNGCLGFDVQKDASKSVTYQDAVTSATEAFNAWTTAACPTGKVSVAVQDLGPVDCAEAAYDQYGPNQNVVVFHDTTWPYWTAQEIAQKLKSPTIALTTVTFDKDTGELYDADIEINSADHTVIPTDSTGGDVYDLRAVLTHEAGHFLGMGHSADQSAVMYSADEGSDTKKRSLAADDLEGICSIYLPNGTRTVDSSVQGGSVAAGPCDPTPRHGFTSQCPGPAPTQSSGCSAASGAETESQLPAGLAAVLIVAVRRRTRPRPR